MKWTVQVRRAAITVRHNVHFNSDVFCMSLAVELVRGRHRPRRRPFLLRLTAGGRGVRGATRGMRACIYATAGGCGLVTAVGATVRSRLTRRGRALREVARPRVLFMAGLPLLARDSVVVRC